MNTLGKKIREMRKNTHVTQKELAKKLKLAESTISMYERGERQPDYETLQKLANFFEVSTDYLLGRSNSTLQVVSNEVPLEERVQKSMDLIMQQTPEEQERIYKVLKSMYDEII